MVLVESRGVQGCPGRGTASPGASRDAQGAGLRAGQAIFESRLCRRAVPRPGHPDAGTQICRDTNWVHSLAAWFNERLVCDDFKWFAYCTL